MTEKKTHGRFTLQFNLADPQQKKVSNLLERQGRHKTQFLTNAVIYYLNSDGMNKAGTTHTVDDATLEQRIRRILAKVQSEGLPRRASSDHQFEHRLQNDMEGDDFSAIDDTLREFEKQ